MASIPPGLPYLQYPKYDPYHYQPQQQQHYAPIASYPGYARPRVIPDRYPPIPAPPDPQPPAGFLADNDCGSTATAATAKSMKTANPAPGPGAGTQQSGTNRSQVDTQVPSTTGQASATTTTTWGLANAHQSNSVSIPKPENGELQEEPTTTSYQTSKSNQEVVHQKAGGDKSEDMITQISNGLSRAFTAGQTAGRQEVMDEMGMRRHPAGSRSAPPYNARHPGLAPWHAPGPGGHHPGYSESPTLGGRRAISAFSPTDLPSPHSHLRRAWPPGSPPSPLTPHPQGPFPNAGAYPPPPLPPPPPPPPPFRPHDLDPYIRPRAPNDPFSPAPPFPSKTYYPYPPSSSAYSYRDTYLRRPPHPFNYDNPHDFSSLSSGRRRRVTWSDPLEEYNSPSRRSDPPSRSGRTRPPARGILKNNNGPVPPVMPRSGSFTSGDGDHGLSDSEYEEREQEELRRSGRKLRDPSPPSPPLSAASRDRTIYPGSPSSPSDPASPSVYDSGAGSRSTRSHRTMVSREKIDPEVLDDAGEDFVVRRHHILILRNVADSELQTYERRTMDLRGKGALSPHSSLVSLVSLEQLTLANSLHPPLSR